jgi:N4-(beta-N-acetylglucosaminyl)-L-asparaginase
MITRRDFVKSATLAAAAPLSLGQAAAAQGAPAVMRTVRPVVIADYSGWEFKNGGTENAVQRAFRLITEGQDVLDALIAGVNIPELDPLETGIGYGGLPNGNGVVELDASCMHGPKKRAGAVACLEGVRTPTLVGKAGMV